jgi:deoxyribodipyrimidine photo-lyase
VSEPSAPAAGRVLVWLKRDFRLRDHAPLAAAASAHEALAIWVIEPDWLGSAEFDPQHLAWQWRCGTLLGRELARRGLPLLIRCGALPEVLSALHARWPFERLFSHEETGPGWSWTRDRAVGRWCRERGVAWREWPQTGVVRPLRDRLGWAGRWQRRMDAPEAAAPARWPGAWPTDPGLWPDDPDQPVPDGWLAAPWGGAGLPPGDHPAPGLHALRRQSRPLPEAGEAAAWTLLEGFLAGRGRDYRHSLSSPLSAESGCSRLSAHLAAGTISMRSVHRASRDAIAATDDPALAHGLRGFVSRLRWHCHFMQKLEDEPSIETRHFARTLDGLRPGDIDGGGRPMDAAARASFEAWCEGRTGYPMVDACMRQLRATGWLNFRMRAMLTSFAAYHLWLHWREPGLFLARQFLDFEPGIHWSQVQMQSGSTGINTLRIYSPARQATDHDPLGVYRRRWLPEFGTAAYPAPVVDEAVALARAREQMFGLRAQARSRLEADAIQQRHGSRRSGLPPTTRQRRQPGKGSGGGSGSGDQGELF